MSKIPFDIKFRPQIESGKYKVETRDGKPIRIICFDAQKNYPIVGLSNDENDEPFTFTKEGKFIFESQESDSMDLFLVTPEMSELELAIAKYRPPTDSKETIQRIASELLSLARKQLQPEIDAEIEKAYKTADEVQYRKGREEALKDLPRWGLSTGCFDDGRINEGVLYYKFHAIPLKTLEELPGFKEDEK